MCKTCVRVCVCVCVFGVCACICDAREFSSKGIRLHSRNRSVHCNRVYLAKALVLSKTHNTDSGGGSKNRKLALRKLGRGGPLLHSTHYLALENDKKEGVSANTLSLKSYSWGHGHGVRVSFSSWPCLMMNLVFMSIPSYNYAFAMEVQGDKSFSPTYVLFICCRQSGNFWLSNWAARQLH